MLYLKILIFVFYVLEAQILTNVRSWGWFGLLLFQHHIYYLYCGNFYLVGLSSIG